MKVKQVRLSVFLPTALLFIGCIFFNLYDNEQFSAVSTFLYEKILDYFGWAFLLTAVAALGVCIWLYFSPIGNIRIGGASAKPMLTKWNWFTVTLGTTIAAGIVFWGAAEPIQHVLYPPVSSGLEAMTADSARFAMAAIYRHWTILPYAIYTLLAVVFAFACYNMKKPFTIGAMLAPIIPQKYQAKTGILVDIICIFALVTGLSASLGIGTLSINSGLGKLFGTPSNQTVWLMIIIVVGGISIISAISGIKKGITLLSNCNVAIYIFILLFILCFGGMLFILSFGFEGLGKFINTFFEKALFSGVLDQDPWTKNWTMYYFGNWMAWAPITAVFLGKISYGRKVKEIIMMNLAITSIFSIVWFMIISGATINMLFNHPGSGLIEAYEMGYENVIYQLFKNLPLSNLMIPIYLIAVLISFVTAADSTTVAISDLCCKELGDEMQNGPMVVKVIWGIIIASVTWIMMSIGDGITGIKMLSNIGGLPAMFLIIFVMISAVRLGLNPQKYNRLGMDEKEKKKKDWS